jgi:adenine-specific DNA-methyltransferase
MSGIDVRCAEAMEFLATVPDGSVNLVAVDPPYFKVKDEPWDHAWDKPEGFLSWVGELCDEFRRVLAPNGSLYVFASPQMSTRVEMVVRERFEVLTEIVWVKDSGWFRRSSKETLRTYATQTERVIFAEQFGADGSALQGSGYRDADAKARAGVFEPLRAYLDGEREAAGWSVRQVAEAYQKVTGSRTVTGMAGHWFGASQWTLPTEKNYLWLRSLFNADGGGHLSRGYEHLRREYEDLRAEYEVLRAEYEDLRRPFSVSTEVPFTDVWTFATVPPGKRGALRHPCEKPVDMMEHIVTASSRPGDLVLDCFLGSGSTAVAARNTGRRFVGCDMSQEWVDYTEARLAELRLEV